MSQKKDILLLGRDEKEPEKDFHPGNGNQTVFILSAVPEPYWVAIFISTWKSRLEELPPEFTNIQPEFNERKLTVNYGPEVNLGRLERHLRAIIAITNKISDID